MQSCIIQRNINGEPPAAGDVAIGSGTEYGLGMNAKNDFAYRS
jgi:hypothetical protein